MGVFFHGFEDDLLNRGGNLAVELAWRNGRGLDVFEGDGDGRFGHEGDTPGEHLVEDHAQGVDVAAVVAVAVGLFGGHVFGGADHGAIAGQRFGPHEGFRQAEIDEISVSIKAQQDV